MKTRYLAFTVFAAVLAAAGCTNLDEKVYSDIPRDDFFKDPQLLELYSGRAYMTLQNYCTEQSLWTLNLQSADECAVPMNSQGEWGNNVRYAELQEHNFVVSNRLINMGWQFCFSGIAACNDVIYETERSPYQFAGKERILAEMKVLRAFYYFCAIDGWGNVPYSVDPSDKSLPEQKDRAFMFSFIEKEIADNIDALDEAGAANYGKVTKGVAYTLLAKMYLNAQEWIGQAMWDEAAEACQAVISSGVYSIAPSYKDCFDPDNDTRGSMENIFVIPYSSIYTLGADNAFTNYFLCLNGSDAAKYNITASCWDGFICQPDFFQTYDAADTRRSDTWLFGAQTDANGRPAQYENAPYVIEPVFPEALYKTGRSYSQGAKLWKWTYQSDGSLRNANTYISMDNDFALFRYADVLLMYAEAVLRGGEGDLSALLANPDFQLIRTRAGLTPFAALTLDELLAERGHELAWEGWRRQDLIRFGKWNDAWWAKPASEPHTKLYPIPREVLNTNSNLTQNDGYPR